MSSLLSTRFERRSIHHDAAFVGSLSKEPAEPIRASYAQLFGLGEDGIDAQVNEVFRAHASKLKNV